MARTGRAGLPSDMRHALALLEEHGSWRIGSSWVVGSSTRTRVALKALVHRGLAVREREGDVLVYRSKTDAEFAARRRRAKLNGGRDDVPSGA